MASLAIVGLLLANHGVLVFHRSPEHAISSAVSSRKPPRRGQLAMSFDDRGTQHA